MKFFSSIKKSFLTILTGAFLCIALSSCEGFFTDNSVDEKIRAAIDYANAPFSTFVVSVNPLAGKITPSGQVQYKPTDYQNIEFVLNPSYEFIEWSFSYKQISQAADTPTLTAADKNWWKDYITILKETESEPDSKGQVTYNLQIKFDKAAENLLIEPICVLKPEIKSFSPLYNTSGVPRGSEISVEFNTPIDVNSIFFSQSEIDAIGGITDVLKNTDRHIYGYKKDSKTIFKSIEISLGNDENIVNDNYSISYNQTTNTLFIKPVGSLEFVADVADVKIKFTDSLKSSAGASMLETYKTICVNKRSDKFATVQIKYNTIDFQSLNNFSVSENQTYQFSDNDNKNQFLYWKIYADANYQDSVDKITVKTDNGNSLTDQLKKSSITFCANSEISGNEGVRIEAIYKPRPAIADGGFSPSDSSSGVAKDKNIEITFTQPVDLDSFIAGYGISISGDDARAYFERPELEGDKKIIIKTKSDSKIFVETGTTKIISVRIPGTLYYTASENGEDYQILLGADVTKNYRINSSTVDNAQLEFIEDNNTPAVYTYSGIPNRPLNTDDSFTVTVNVNSDYQFLYRWIKENDPGNLVEITQSEINANAFNVKIKGKCGTDTPVKLTPVIKERLRVTKITPVTNTNAVPRDTGINIWFNHAPDLERCKQQIGIYYNGVNVKTVNFPTAGWDIEDTPDSFFGGYKLTIPASTTNRVSVDEGQTGLIQIAFSKDFYYSENGDAVYYGGEGYSHVYDINSETTEKTTVIFNSSVTGGSITASNQTADNKYSLGKEIPVTFTPSADYEFLYWSWGNNSHISFEDRYNQTTKITVNSVSTSPITVTAVCTPKLKVVSFKIKNTTGDTLTEPAAGIAYPKDSDIVITFNHANVSVDNLKKAVDLSCGTSLKDVYTNFEPSWNNDSNTTTLTFTAKDSDRIQVTGILNVTLDNSFYYNYTDSVITSPRRINLEGTENFSYLINADTRQKATIKVSNVTGGTITDANGNNFTTNSTSYSKDEEFILKAVPRTGFQFKGWNVGGTVDNVELSSLENATTTVKIVGSATGETTITPKYVEYLAVGKLIINDETFVSSKSYGRDSVIKILFTKTPVTPFAKYIKLYCDGREITDKYEIKFDPTDSTKTMVMLIPNINSGERVMLNAPANLLITIDDDICYSDETYGTVNLEKNYEETIQLVQETENKAHVTITADTTNNMHRHISIKVDDGRPSHDIIENNYSLDDQFVLECTTEDGYRFIKWEATVKAHNDSSPIANPYRCVLFSSRTSPVTTVKIDNLVNQLVNQVHQPVGIDVEIKAYCSEDIKVSRINVDNKTFSSSQTYPKDSTIKLTFNKDLPSNKQSELFEHIHLKYNGNDVLGTDQYFSIEDIDANNLSQLIIKPNTGKFLPLKNTTDTGVLELTIDKDFFYYQEVASGTPQKMTLGTDYTSTINIDYKSSKSFTINHVMNDAYNNSACNYGKLTIIPEASDGKYYYGQNLKVKISSINEYYWISSEPSFTPNSTASFDKTLNTNETNRFDTYTFDIVVKSLSDNILTVNSYYKNTFSVLSISPTPATYYENNNPVYPSAVPYDTPIVITFTDELNVKQLLQNNSDNTKYTSEAILKAIFSEFYSYKEGVKTSLYTYYTLVDVCYAKYPTVDSVRYSSPRNPTNSSVLVLKPTQKLRELFYKSTGQLVYPPQNTVHITFKQDYTNFVSVKGTDMSKFVKDLTKYDNPGTEPLDISFQIKNSVSATAPDILLSNVYIAGSSSPTGRASYLEENAFITATPSTLMSSIPKSCVAKGENGEIYFNFRVSGAGNFGNVMDGIEPTPIKVPFTVEAFTYGKMKRAQYPNDGFVTVPDAQHYIIHYLQYPIQSEDGLCDMPTNFALGGFIDVPANDCYLIQLNFSFGDINGSVIQKTYYVVYDQNNLYSSYFN